MLSAKLLSGNLLSLVTGVEASAQAVKGKRKSISVRVASKSSKYTKPLAPFPICCA